MEGVSVNCCFVMLCCSGLIDTQLSVDENKNEDLTQSFSDKSRRLPQTSHSTEQSVFSSECVRVDASNQLDTAEACRQSDTPRDTRVHAESDKHRCKVCNKMFTQADSLKCHMCIHTGERPFSCNVCNKKFNRSDHLKYHMQIHNDERPFSCKVCNKKFPDLSHLKCHMRIHASERPFSCNVCNKKFTQSCQLRRHILIHTGERLFSCTVCNKKFTQSTSLKYHAHPQW